MKQKQSLLDYNNNQKFLQKRLDSEILKTSKIFEKAEMKWVCVDELKKMRPKFRSYFQNIVDMMLNQKESIKHFIEKCEKNTKKYSKKTLHNKKRQIHNKKSKTKRLHN